MKLFGVERAMLVALSRAILPGGPAPDASVDYQAFWVELFTCAPPLVLLGVRASIWLFAVLPIALLGKLRPFLRLSDDERELVVTRANTHRLYLVRQAVMALKTFTAMAYFRDPAVRRHFELDRLVTGAPKP